MPITIKNIRFVLLVAALTILSNSCGKRYNERPCVESRYGFEVTCEFTPQRENYNVGDTIFLNSNFTKILFDVISRQNVDFSNSIGIAGNLAVGLLDSNTNSILPAIPKFKLINLSGSTTPIPNAIDGGVNIFYKEESNYNFKLAIVCLERGIFRFGLTDLGSQGLVGKTCTNAGFFLNVTNTNKNLDLFQYAMGYYPDGLAIPKIYCFRVQ